LDTPLRLCTLLKFTASSSICISRIASSAFFLASVLRFYQLPSRLLVISAIAFLSVASILMDQPFLLDSCQHLFNDFKIIPVFFFPFASPSRFADFLLLSDPFDLFLILGDIAPACTDVSTVKAVTHLLAQGSFVGLKHTPEGTLTASRFLRIILYRVFPRFSLCALGGVLSRCRRFRFSVSFHFLYNMFSETFA